MDTNDVLVKELESEICRLKGQLDVVAGQNERYRADVRWAGKELGAMKKNCDTMVVRYHQLEMRAIETAAAFNSRTIDYREMKLKHMERSNQLAKARLENQRLRDQIAKGPSFDEEREVWRARCVALKEGAATMLEKQAADWYSVHSQLCQKLEPPPLSDLEEEALGGMIVMGQNPPIPKIKIPFRPKAKKVEANKKRVTRSFFKASGHVHLDFYELEEIAKATKPKRARH